MIFRRPIEGSCPLPADKGAGAEGSHFFIKELHFPAALTDKRTHIHAWSPNPALFPKVWWRWPWDAGAQNKNAEIWPHGSWTPHRGVWCTEEHWRPLAKNAQLSVFREPPEKKSLYGANAFIRLVGSLLSPLPAMLEETQAAPAPPTHSNSFKLKWLIWLKSWLDPNRDAVAGLDLSSSCAKIDPVCLN